MPTKIEGRIVDGRYKPGIDRGAMSSNRIPLPLKQKYKSQFTSKIKANENLNQKNN